MALNLEKVYAKFRDITESLERLQRFRGMSPQEFLVDRDSQDIASFRLIVATEAAIDTCLHISAKRLKLVAEEYAACFHLLAEHGLIDVALASRLAQMARFRNILIHRYWQIDYARVYEVITGPNLEDLAAFVKQVGKIIAGEK